MSDKREIEVKGQDVEAAVELGLQKLGVSRADVSVEVVDAGSRGLLGIGAREAVVRLTRSGMPVARPPKVETAAPPPPRPVQPKLDPKPQPKPQPPAPAIVATSDDESAEAVDVAAELAEEQATAVSVIEDLINRLQFDATVVASLTEPDDVTGRQIPVVEINGNDLGGLIGPRGDTLASVQYIARLMVSHRIRRRAHFVVDVEGYRQRREKALARLAERMATKALNRRRPVSLEPMPPHERRIIHMTLRDHDSVYTQSRGEGNRRRVRILPK